MTYSNKPEATPTKRRSLISALYNPHLGDSIRPIGESLNGFIRLLAIVFALNGLFPKNHPALTGEGEPQQLNLSTVLATAWNSLEFTKAGMPRVVVFFAVISGLLFTAFSLITILALSFVGHAHAQTFTPTDTTHDLGWNIIDYLFSPTKYAAAYDRLNADYGTFAGGAMPNANLQLALWAALGTFSNAMLVCAGILLFYHLVSMVLNTAHSGVVMGKSANQVWAPIRLAAAVILLVPASGNLNVGQLLVMQVAQWGSGLATNIWLGFEAALMSKNGVSVPSTPSNDKIAEVVINVAQIMACEYYYNEKQANIANSSNGNAAFSDPNKLVAGWQWTTGGLPILPDPEGLPDGTIVYHFEPATKELGQNDMCGKIAIPPMGQFTNTGDANTDLIASNMYMAVYSAFFNAVESNTPSIRSMGAGVQIFVTDSGIAQDTGDIDTTALVGNLAQAVNNFQNDLNSKVVTAASTTFTPTNKYGQIGWLGAAPFWNQVAAQQSVVQSAAMDALPIVTLPKINMGAFAKILHTSLRSTANNVALAKVVRTGGGGCTDVAEALDNGQMMALLKKLDSNLVKDLFEIADHYAAGSGVWCAGDGLLGVRFTGSDPLHQMAGWGHANMEASVGIFNLGLWLMMAGAIANEGILGRIATGVGALVAKGSEETCDPDPDAYQNAVDAGAEDPGLAASFAPGINCKHNNKNELPAIALGIATIVPGGASVLGEALLPIGALFFTLGTLFGYILPLIPFMHFFFGIITWIALLFEAVVAMPLVALAHITPEGEGLPGGHARTAYQMAFGLLLRPTLMVLGLIAGYFCLILAASLLNMFFSGAMHVTAGGGAVVKIAKIIYSVIYCMVLVSVANHAFQLIGHFPKAVLGWINIQAPGGVQMGHPGDIEGKTALAAGFISSKGMPMAGSGFKSIGKGAGGTLQDGSAKIAGANAYGAAKVAGGMEKGSLLGNLGAVSGNQFGDSFKAGGASGPNQRGFGGVIGNLAGKQNAENDSETAKAAAATQADRHNDLMGALGRDGGDAGNSGGAGGGDNEANNPPSEPGSATSAAPSWADPSGSSIPAADRKAKAQAAANPPGPGGSTGGNTSGSGGGNTGGSTGGQGKPKGWDGSFEDV